MAYFFSRQNLGMFWKGKDFGPTLYQNSRFNTCRNLGVFHKNQVFDTKKPLPMRLVKILGFLKTTKILGLHRIEILGLALAEILGYFIRTMFLMPKTHDGLLFLVKILGFLKSAKILGLHCIKISFLTPVEILEYFLKTRFLTPKTHYLCGFSKSWVF